MSQLKEVLLSLKNYMRNQILISKDNKNYGYMLPKFYVDFSDKTVGILANDVKNEIIN